MERRKGQQRTIKAQQDAARLTASARVTSQDKAIEANKASQVLGIKDRQYTAKKAAQRAELSQGRVFDNQQSLQDDRFEQQGDAAAAASARSSTEALANDVRDAKTAAERTALARKNAGLDRDAAVEAEELRYTTNQERERKRITDQEDEAQKQFSRGEIREEEYNETIRQLNERKRGIKPTSQPKQEEPLEERKFKADQAAAKKKELLDIHKEAVKNNINPDTGILNDKGYEKEVALAKKMLGLDISGGENPAPIIGTGEIDTGDATISIGDEISIDPATGQPDPTVAPPVSENTPQIEVDQGGVVQPPAQVQQVAEHIEKSKKAYTSGGKKGLYKYLEDAVKNGMPNDEAVKMGARIQQQAALDEKAATEKKEALPVLTKRRSKSLQKLTGIKKKIAEANAKMDGKGATPKYLMKLQDEWEKKLADVEEEINSYN